MRINRFSPVFLTVSTILAIVLSWATDAVAAPRYKILHAFGKGTDGVGLWGSLLLDKQGNVYGTTAAGGKKLGGTVFKLTPEANGRWPLSILHAFGGSNDGGESTAGLIFNSAGSLYGTTRLGGKHTYGIVFKLTPDSGGWTETVLYDFPLPGGGCCPYGGVVSDNSGNLYGATYSAFELSAGFKGWKATVLYSFNGQHGDGSGPFAGLILDSAGNLYGTTEMGGTSKNCGGGCGIAFELRRMPDGKWKETILHSFGSSNKDGVGPGVGALVIDGSGSLYGTTDVGGPHGGGTVFKLTPVSDGRWKETILHGFTQGVDGDHVSAGVVMDQSGNLYGTTIAGGDPNCDCGVVYKLAPSSNGKWIYTVLHRFTGYDGAEPDANLILDDKGNLYGTTPIGGAHGGGVVFQVTP
jgi:uncharacterized repeat protein (TIGR03803 family)